MAKNYNEMLNQAFLDYYERFRALNATTKENAVTRDEIFPNGENLIDTDRMHKMLSMGIVKRVGVNRYWLDEKRAEDGNGVLKQRIFIVLIAVVLGLVIGILKTKGIL